MIVLRNQLKKKLITIIKEAEKHLKYQSLAIEISRMWNLKRSIVPLVVAALGLVPHSLQKNLDRIPGNSKDWEIEEIAMPGTGKRLAQSPLCSMKRSGFVPEKTGGILLQTFMGTGQS